jgi:hypothetical protein
LDPADYPKGNLGYSKYPQQLEATFRKEFKEFQKNKDLKYSIRVIQNASHANAGLTKAVQESFSVLDTAPAQTKSSACSSEQGIPIQIKRTLSSKDTTRSLYFPAVSFS